MPHDVDISIGADSSAAAAGLAQLRQYGEDAHRELTGIFARTIAFTGLVEGFKVVIEKAHEIHHEAERFGVDAQSLQLIGNAAAQLGLPLESVSRAMNKMLIGGEAALAGQTALRVDMEKFHAANPAEKFLLIADAVKEAGLNTESYDAIAKIFGTRFGTELIPLLIQGAAGITEVGNSTKRMGDDTLETLDKAYKAWEIFKTNLVGGAAPAIALVLRGLSYGVVSLGAAFSVTAEAAIGHFKAINRAAHGDLKGASAAIEEAYQKMGAAKDKWVHDMAVTAGDIVPTADVKFQPTDPEAIAAAAAAAERAKATGGVSGEGSSVPSGGSSASHNLDALASKQRQYDLDHLTAQDKLKSLELERTEIEDNLATAQQTGALSAEDEAGFKLKLLENDTEREKIEGDLKKLADDRRDAAEQEEIAAERHNRTQGLILQYGSEIGQAMAQQLDLQDQIDKVTERINEAWGTGEEETAQILTNLRDQLQTEKDTSAEITRQNTERVRMKREGLDDKQTQQQKVQSSEGGLTTANLSNMPKVLALLQAGFQLSEWALTTATDPKTGVITQDALIKQILEYNQKTNFGQKNLTAGDQNQALHIQQLQFLQEGQNDRAQSAAQALYLQNLGLSVGNAFGRGGVDAIFNLPIFQQMLAQLEQMNGRLRSPLAGQR